MGAGRTGGRRDLDPLHGSASLPQYGGCADDLTCPGYYEDYCSGNDGDLTAHGDGTLA